mgnify:CR=1 FL=1|tara:strand:- start:151 stop:363 length:213 start_codon:yes stop_codon:yes gene_type:complete
MSNDVAKEINDEWIKLLDYIGKVAPDDLKKIQSMNEKYGGIPKNLFEQGYRSGFNSATSFMRESIKEVED